MTLIKRNMAGVSCLFEFRLCLGHRDNMVGDVCVEVQVEGELLLSPKIVRAWQPVNEDIRRPSCNHTIVRPFNHHKLLKCAPRLFLDVQRQG